MDKTEFVNNCRSLGYCNKKQAEEYYDKHPDANEKDYEELCRMYFGKFNISRFHYHYDKFNKQQVKTTKHYRY